MEICLDKNELTLSNENFPPPDRISYFGILINEQQNILVGLWQRLLLVGSVSGVMCDVQVCS